MRPPPCKAEDPSIRRPIAGDGCEMWRAVQNHIFYHMQHPTVLRYTVEEAARIVCRSQNDCALLTVECADGSRRIQRPLGPKAWEWMYEEIEKMKNSSDGRKAQTGPAGIFVAGLLPAEAEEFRRRTGFSGEWIRDALEVLDLAQWDADLKGRRYKEFRQAVGRAREAGLLSCDAAEEGGKEVRRREFLDLYRRWLARKPRQYCRWIETALLEMGEIPGFLCRAAFCQGRPVAVSAALHQGRYGYLFFAFGEESRLRAQELLDYEILRELKNRGVVRLDLGCAGPPGVSVYKEKLGPIRTETLFSAWIPPR